MSERERQLARGEWRVPVAGQETSAVFEPPSDGSDDGTVFVLAHGAGGNMNDRGVVQTANVLRARGLGVVRFNFLYREKKSGRPDPVPRLEECYRAVVARVREETQPRSLIIGGRSMGGRAASMLAAAGFKCDGLLLLAYPLHPPGKPDQQRDARSVLHSESDGKGFEARDHRLGDALGRGCGSQLSRPQVIRENRCPGR